MPASSLLLTAYKWLQDLLFNMKSLKGEGLSNKPDRLLSAFFLTGILCLSNSFVLVQNATAATQVNSDFTLTSKGKLIADRSSDDGYVGNRGRRSDDDYQGDRGRSSDDGYVGDRGRRSDDDYQGDRRSDDDRGDRPRRIDDNDRGDRPGRRNYGGSQLPTRIANAVIQDLSKQTGIAPRQLQVTQSSRQTWSDSCLGLGGPAEICAQALVQGWRVVVSNNRRNWFYRTDSTGRVLRLEDSRNSANNTNKLPNNIASAVLRDAAQQLNVSNSQVELVRAQRRNWSDSCLGLGRLDYQCARVVVPGWLVTVESGRSRLVYRTGDNGRAIVLDEAASSFEDNAFSDIRPVQIPRSQLPPDLDSDEVFRAIASGGIAGRTYETTLFEDGRVVRVLVSDRNASRPQTYQISRQQVRQFQRLLQQQQFERFDNLSYPPSRGAADFLNVTLTSQDATTSYSDINQERLPQQLQQVIQAWNQIASDRI